MSFWPPWLRHPLTPEWLDWLQERILSDEERFRTIFLLIADTQQEMDLALRWDIDTIFRRHCSGLALSKRVPDSGHWMRIYEEDEHGRIGSRISEFRAWPFEKSTWYDCERNEYGGVPGPFVRLMHAVDKDTQVPIFDPEKLQPNEMTMTLEDGWSNRILCFRESVSWIIGKTRECYNFNF